jgi:hypothetical protein
LIESQTQDGNFLDYPGSRSDFLYLPESRDNKRDASDRFSDDFLILVVMDGLLLRNSAGQ